MEATNELDRRCEIDGHTWNYGYYSYGLFLGSKTLVTTQWCSYCGKHDQRVLEQAAPENILGQMSRVIFPSW